MSINIASIGITVRSRNCLIAAGMTTVEDVAHFIRDHGVVGLLKIPNMSHRSAYEVIAAVAESCVEQQTPTQTGGDDNTNERPVISSFDLRDYFAAKAMQSLLTAIDEFPDEHWRTGVAMDAYMMADAMIEARRADPGR